MIRIYPYPFSKHVKSLPDPPPAKSREIRHFECKKYENDYSWLLEAKNNLKKCFHLCNLCSKKFNCMRCLVKNSNVHYEYNNKTLKNKLRENVQFRDIYDINLNENNKNTKPNNESYDVKNNILKINSNKFKNNTNNNHRIENIKATTNNSIIFSNSLNHNENESLSFNDDVYIFLDDYSKKELKSYKKDEESYIRRNSENLNVLKQDDTIMSKYKPEDMIIHIKRHFKNNISYFACEHVKPNDLYNLKDEDNNYDNINIYMCNNDKEYFMNDCIINFTEENELYSLSQPYVVTGVDEDGKESQKEQTNIKNMYNNKFKNSPFLRKNDIKEENSENNINNIEKINENCEFLNISNFINNKEFEILSSARERTNVDDIILHINEDKKNSKKIYSVLQNDKINNKLKCDTINENMYFKNRKDFHENSKNDSEIIFDDNVNDNMDCNNTNKLLPLHKIDDDIEENVISLDKDKFYFNNFLKKKNENYKSYSKNNMILKGDIEHYKNHGIMKNLNDYDEDYENRVSKNDEKYNIKKANKSINLNEERSSGALIDELNERLFEKKNLYVESNDEKNKNISCTLAYKEKNKRIISKSEVDLINNNRNCFKEVLNNSFVPTKQNMDLLNFYQKNIKKKKTINNVNIDGFKNKLINGMNSATDISGNILHKSIILDNEDKKINNCYDKIHEINISNINTDYFKENLNFISNENDKINTKKGNFKEVNQEINDNISIQNFDIGLKSLINDEHKKKSNIKLLKQIKNNTFFLGEKMDEDKIKNDCIFLGKIEQIEQMQKKKSIENVVHDKILDINKPENCKEVKNKKYIQSKLVQNMKDSILSGSIKKNKYFTDKKSSNLRDVYKKSANGICLNMENIDMKTLNDTINGNKNKNYINTCDNSNTYNNINDNNCIDNNSKDKNSIPKNNTYNFLIKNYEPGLKNCEDSQIKNELTEINCTDVRVHNYDFDVGNLCISKKNENNSTNSWNNSASISANKTKFTNNLMLNNNKDDLVRKNKLNIHYLKNKIYFSQNKGVNIQHNNINDRSKESDKLKCYENINNGKIVSNHFIYGTKKEENKQPNIENEADKVQYDEKLNEKLKKKLGSILNLCTNPNKINIHNKIYAPDIEKNNLDNKKVIYINNNYFFNVDKDNYFENNNGKLPENSMKYNFKKFDLQFCKSKDDFYSFKYMSNVLSSSCSLSKEYIFSKRLESNILEEKFHKLNDLRNKYLLKKYLNKVLDKKKFQSINNADKKVSSINQRKLKYNMKKDIYDENLKSEYKFNTKENCNESLNIKQKINNYKINKINTNLCEAPKSPKKQDKIPKPSASKLEINSLSYLKKTPSYPFEEFNF